MLRAWGIPFLVLAFCSIPMLVAWGMMRDPVRLPAEGPVHAGVPFVERDTTAILVCVSSSAGLRLPPFLMPLPTATPGG
jgi:hypothetical protein